VKYIIETRGRTLEETAALFDGEQPVLELQQLGHDAATFTLNELQSDTLRSRLDARLQEAFEEDGSDQVLDKSTVKLPEDTSASASSSSSKRQSQELQRPPSVVSIRLS